MSKKSFKKTWASQSDLGKKFGLSAIAIGKKLLAHNLRDSETKLPTKKAIDEGWCVSTPLKSGIPYYMWSIEKVSALIASDGHAAISQAEFAANEIISVIMSANKELDAGNDKIGYLMIESAFMDAPKDLRRDISEILTDKGFGEYIGWMPAK